MPVQAVIFEKKHWNTTDARNWLKKKKYTPIKRVHITKNYYRYRILNPKKFNSFFIKKSSTKGVKYVIGTK